MTTAQNHSNPISAFLVSFVFAIGIMLSPDMLSMLGRFYGRTGLLGIVLIGMSGGAYFVLMPTQFNRSNRPGGSFLSSVSICVQVITVIFLATGLLVSSGFVFNEVFVYWFPNFGFAFILLFFLMTLQLLSLKTIKYFQFAFIGISLIGLISLIVIGISKPINLDQFATISHIGLGNIEINTWMAPILFFVGIDMGFIFYSSPHHSQDRSKTYTALIIAVMCLLLMAYGIIALGHVNPDRLSSTSISHIIIGKKILGNGGRQLMGVIIIFGTLAAIHALFTNIKYKIRHIYNISENNKLPKISILILGSIIGGLMAKGLAGYEILETYILSAFALWLIFYTFFYGIALIKQKEAIFTFKGISKVMVFLIFGGSVITFVITNDNPMIIIKFIIVSITLSITSALVYKFRKTNELIN